MKILGYKQNRTGTILYRGTRKTRSPRPACTAVEGRWSPATGSSAPKEGSVHGTPQHLAEWTYVVMSP